MSKQTLLRALIVIAIFLAAGPEIIAAIELTTLLEILGTTLFLVAYSAGVRMAIDSALRTARGILIPLVPEMVLRSRAKGAGEKTFAAIYCVFHAAHWSAIGLVCLVGTRELWRMVA